MVDIKELYNVLDHLIDLHQSLYQLAEEKKTILLKNDVEALTALTQNERKLIAAIEAAETNRQEIVHQLLAQRGLVLADESISGLAKALTNIEDKTKLMRYREQLSEIIMKLRQRNEQNQKLLEQSLSFVHESLQLFTDAPEEDYIYKKPAGSVLPPQVNRSIINKKA